MAENIKFIKATDTDIATYISIVKKVNSKIYMAVMTADEVRAEMNRGPLYMIRSGNDTVGIISYETRPDGSVYITELVIDPQFQGKGYGRAAMQKVLSEIGTAPVSLITHPENAPAIRLYESLGFYKSGVRKENMFGDGEPRIEFILKKISSKEKNLVRLCKSI